MATIRDKVGHLETLPIDLLYAHLDVSFIFNHLDAMNGGPNFSSVTPPRKKAANLVKTRLHRHNRASLCVRSQEATQITDALSKANVDRA